MHMPTMNTMNTMKMMGIRTWTLPLFTVATGSRSLLSRSLLLSRSWRTAKNLLQHQKYQGYATSSREITNYRNNIVTFEVSCGSHGAVTVDIYNADLLTAPSTPLIIYLPPIGITSQPLSPPPLPRLSVNSSSTSSILSRLPIARINYRWNIQPSSSSDSPSSSLAFPTPLHDTLHAFTWLTTSYLPSFTTSNPTADSSPVRPLSPYASAASRAAKRESLRPLFIYGSFLGGTLASSLSLTETQARPVGSSIEGVIIRNGIFDWTNIATSRPATKAIDDLALTAERGVYDTDTLHALKTQLFTSPASAFDPFASPLLFFRSAGLSAPSYFPGHTPSPSPSPTHDPALLDGLSLSKEELDSLRANYSKSTPSPSQSDDDEEIVISRRSALRFPPKDSGLRIPLSLFLTTSASESGVKAKRKRKGQTKAEEKLGEEMHRQAEEMVKVMRRSLVTYEFKEGAVWNGDPHAASEERVQIHELGLEDSDQEEVEVVEEWVDGLKLE